MVRDWNFVLSYLCQNDNAGSDTLIKNYKQVIITLRTKVTDNIKLTVPTLMSSRWKYNMRQKKTILHKNLKSCTNHGVKESIHTSDIEVHAMNWVTGDLYRQGRGVGVGVEVGVRRNFRWTQSW
jgi:hypothetical protein